MGGVEGSAEGAGAGAAGAGEATGAFGVLFTGQLESPVDLAKFCMRGEGLPSSDLCIGQFGYLVLVPVAIVREVKDCLTGGLALPVGIG